MDYEAKTTYPTQFFFGELFSASLQSNSTSYFFDEMALYRYASQIIYEDFVD